MELLQKSDTTNNEKNNFIGFCAFRKFIDEQWSTKSGCLIKLPEKKNVGFTIS